MMNQRRFVSGKPFKRRMKRALSCSLTILIVAIANASLPIAARAGGTCMLHPEPFKLQSDTVHWSIKMVPGSECIQGLRWSSIIIDQIIVVEQPQSGQLIIAGPSFRYLSNPGSRGVDSFKLAISGTSFRITGNSSIEVDVTSQ